MTVNSASRRSAPGLAHATLERVMFSDHRRPEPPQLRGRLLPNQPLAELTWFRVGGPAQVLFMPEDEDDLAYFLAHLPPRFP